MQNKIKLGKEHTEKNKKEFSQILLFTVNWYTIGLNFEWLALLGFNWFHGYTLQYHVNTCRSSNHAIFGPPFLPQPSCDIPGNLCNSLSCSILQYTRGSMNVSKVKLWDL